MASCFLGAARNSALNWAFNCSIFWACMDEEDDGGSVCGCGGKTGGGSCGAGVGTPGRCGVMCNGGGGLATVGAYCVTRVQNVLAFSRVRRRLRARIQSE